MVHHAIFWQVIVTNITVLYKLYKVSKQQNTIISEKFKIQNTMAIIIIIIIV